jgi:hypothetical protein
MGARFIATGSVSVIAGSEIFSKPEEPKVQFRRFKMTGHWDVPVGPVIKVLTRPAKSRKGYGGAWMSEGAVEEVTVGHGYTQGIVRILSSVQARKAWQEKYSFIHNYILWLNEPIADLVPGLTFITKKDKHRRYPIGSPIDLAIGPDFRIVGSIVVEETTVGYNYTQITGRVLTVYSAEESALLTRLNQERERTNGR